MKNNKKTKSTKGGLYIAVCCFAVLAAAIGYAGRSNDKNSSAKPENISSEEIVINNTVPASDRTDNELVTEEVNIPIIYEEEKSEDVKKDESEVIEKDLAVSKKADVLEEEAKFLLPVEGSVVCAFSGNELIYNEHLSDWRTHNGIDISCEKDSAIYSSADGVVSDITDNSMGKSVVIEHKNGYKSVYSNMSEEIELKVGDNVKSGELIGKVSDSNPSDFTRDYHLHFEILYKDKYVDPQNLIEQ